MLVGMDSTTWKPTGEDYLQSLKDQNPWHALNKVPEPLYWPRRRYLASELWKVLSERGTRFQLILGPRRVGKTVTLYQTTQSLLEAGINATRIWHMNMQNPLLMQYSLGAWVRSILNTFQSKDRELFYFLIDEINYTNQWDRWLKAFFDERWPIRVVATSSSIAALRSRTVESGIGRWSEQFLTPYSFAEYLSLGHEFDYGEEAEPTLWETLHKFGAVSDGRQDLAEQRRRFLVVGGFPELIQNEKLRDENIQSALFRSQHTLRSEAIQRVAGMDLPQVFDIRHPIILERLVYLLAQQMTGLVNVSSLSSTLEITRPTTHQYIAYLEKAFIIFSLPNYSTKEESIQRKGKKVYFVDGAVRNAALQRGLAPLDDSNEMGLLIENAAASHLHALSLQDDTRLFHWRDGSQREVDLIYGHHSEPLAFEITTKRLHKLHGIVALQARYPRFKKRCYIVSASNTVFKTPEESADGVGRIPFDTFLRAVSAQTHAALKQRLHHDV